MALKMTSLTIAPRTSWSPVGPENPLRATVKVQDEKSAIEVVLNDDTMRKMLDLVAIEVAEAAQQRMQEFVQHVTALEGSAGPALIGDS